MTRPSDLDRLCAVPFHMADDASRAAVLGHLADAELFAALAEDPRGDVADLMLFDLDGTRAALACDDAAELAAFVGRPVAHAAVPGRVLAGALAAEGRALIVNPGRPSEMLLDAHALGWLERALAQRPGEGEARPESMGAPHAAVVAVLAGPLAARLARMGDLLSGAALVGAVWPGGARGTLLAIEGAGGDEQPAIAKAVAELVAFLPPVDGGLDVTFQPLPLPPGALRLELTQAPAPAPEPAPTPDLPPRLRW